MYNKGNKINPLDATEGYNVKLQSPLVFAILGWACTFIQLYSDLDDINNGSSLHSSFDGFRLSIIIIFSLSIFFTISYVRKRNDYLRITKEGIEFLHSSLFKESIEQKIPWNNIEEISIYHSIKEGKRGFNYVMNIVDHHGLTQKNAFSLHWSVKPLVMVRILKDYSSNKIKIKVEEFFSSSRYY